MRGYNGCGELFHRDLDCATLAGDVIEMPEMMALKWGLTYCPDCIPKPSDLP